jgi:hypothetical protein
MLDNYDSLRTLIHLQREASSWIRERENIIFSRLMGIAVFIFFFFTLLTLPTTLLNSLPIWQKGLLVMLFVFSFFGMILAIAFFSEFRLNNVLSGNIWAPYFGDKGLLPGYFLILRDEKRYGAMKKIIIKDGLTVKELEIIDCLIIDGSVLTLRELINAGRALA